MAVRSGERSRGEDPARIQVVWPSRARPREIRGVGKNGREPGRRRERGIFTVPGFTGAESDVQLARLIIARNLLAERGQDGWVISRDC